MSKYQPRDGSGAAFPNRKTSEKAPDFKGTLLLKGETYDVAIWQKAGSDPRGFLTFSVQLQGSYKGKAQQPDLQPAQPVRGAFPEEDLPRTATLPAQKTSPERYLNPEYHDRKRAEAAAKRQPTEKFIARDVSAPPKYDDDVPF